MITVMTNFDPTAEQDAIANAVKSGKSVKVPALAGTGKSSTTQLIAERKPDDHMLYVVFGRDAADDARAKMPPNVQVATSHSIAFRAVGKNFQHRLNTERVTAKDISERLNIRGWFKIVPADLGSVSRVKDFSSWKIASLANETVIHFCHSDDAEISYKHVPWQKHVANMDELRTKVMPYAQALWDDARSENGWSKFVPDHYFKMWALGNPKLVCDFLCVDEAQDTNPAWGGVIKRQEDLQTVIVGDSYQQLFSWRGTTDIMETFEADAELPLTQSFRFGDNIAVEANRWLEYLGSKLRIRGYEDVEDRVGAVENPTCVLARTNAEVIERAFAAQEQGRKVHIVGKNMRDEIRNFARACAALQAGERTSHKELSIFKTWDDVETYMREEQPRDSFGTFIRLVENFGTHKIEQVIANCVDTGKRDVDISTVHKVKGLEWPSVFVDGGILPDNMEDVQDETLMLTYVAVTRAKTELDATQLQTFHRRREMRKRFDEVVA